MNRFTISFFALFLSLGIFGNAFADDGGKLDQVLKNQQDMLVKLDQILQEVQIVKVRASQR